MANIMQAEGLTKRIGERVLFHDLSIGMDEGQRVGLIAKNGTGKSTLLRVLTGRESCDEGRIAFRRGLRVGYLEQDPHFEPGQTVVEACFGADNPLAELVRDYERCLATEGQPGLDILIDRMEHAKAWDYEQKARQILTKLRIDRFDQPVGTLSGGQRKRVALAGVLIAEPDLLVMDEPTNHLDLDMTEWLEEYLRRTNASLLMVTHDRYFLDRVCSVIVELDEQTLYTYKGNYAYYLEKRQERLDAAKAETDRARNLYRTELDWMRRMPQARGHKARYREEAFYELERVAKRHRNETDVALEVKAARIGSKIFEAEKLCKRFGKTVVLDNFSYVFSRFEKMGIVGPNGTGKSTFVKLLMGLEQPDSGTLDIGETVRFGYYSQDGLQFDEQMRVIDAVREVAEVVDLGDGRRLTAQQFLQHFLFNPEEQHGYIYKLSGGERRRLYLCTVLMRNPNFLVLDEPTNDLDIATLRVLEDYLASFKGCVIVVSHDRYFMDKVVDHLLVFNGQGDIRDFPGNYSDYRDWKEEHERREKQQERNRQEKAAPRTRNTSGKRKPSFKERQEMQQLEAEIEAIENEKKQLEEALCSGVLTAEALNEQSRRHALLTEELDEKTMRWLELGEQFD